MEYTFDYKLYNNVFTVKESPYILAKIFTSKKSREEEEERLDKIKNIKNVSKFVSSFSNIMYIERAPGSDLFVILRRKFFLKEKVVKYIAFNLLLVLRSLHSIGIIHGDIKPDNIVYDEFSKKITLIDFEPNKCTYDYISPENINKVCKDKSPSHDIWCLGSTIFTLLMGYKPYKNIEHLLSGEKHNDIKSDLSKEARDFLSFILIKDPYSRPSIDLCLNHKWFNEYSYILSDNESEKYCEWLCTIS